MGLNMMNTTVVISVCAAMTFMFHMEMAVFYDGIRPVIPEYIEGRTYRTEVVSIAFGLSVGFIASVDIGNSLITNLLNPWSLFLATDIIGIAAPKEWLVPILGVAWGTFCPTTIDGVNTVLTDMSVDLVSAMGNASAYVMADFIIFPVIAIIMQFGMKKGIITAVIVLVTYFTGPMFSTISGDAWVVMASAITLVTLCIMKNFSNKNKETASDSSIFSERVACIRENLPFLMVAGALIAVAYNIHVFVGSDVPMFDLSKIYTMGNTAEVCSLMKLVVTDESMRVLGSTPLIATIAVITGVYGAAGFTLAYVIGHLYPNPIVAVIAGTAIIFVEVMLLGLIGKFLDNFPFMRDTSDNIQSAMNTCVEFTLLIGSIIACGIISTSTLAGVASGFIAGGMIYLTNEVTGRKIMRMAIGPIAAIATGLLPNLTYLIGMTPLVQNYWYDTTGITLPT